MSEKISRKEFDNIERIVVKVLVAEADSLSPEDMEEYRESHKTKRDAFSFIKFVSAKGREEGLQLGLKDGIEIGIEKTLLDMVIKLKKRNVPLEVISEVTGYSIPQIETLSEIKGVNPTE